MGWIREHKGRLANGRDKNGLPAEFRLGSADGRIGRVARGTAPRRKDAWGADVEVQRIATRPSDPRLQCAAKAEQDCAAGYRVVNNHECPGCESFEKHWGASSFGGGSDRFRFLPLILG